MPTRATSHRPATLSRGFTGQEACPGSDGEPVTAYQLTPDTAHLYFMPGADPGEGYAATNDQLWGSTAAPEAGSTAPMNGFVTDYAQAIKDNTSKGWYVVPGTTESMIMGCHTPTTLPVISALATGFAVCDHWYGAAPTMTMPNRAFACAGTSQGRLDDRIKKFTVPSIFGALSDKGVAWKIYGDTKAPLTKLDFPDTSTAPTTNFGLLADFQADASDGQLPAYAFLEPVVGLEWQQRAPQLRRRSGRAADPRRLPRAA